MSYYDSNVIMDLLKFAYKGNKQVVKQIVDITVPYAVAQDYSSLILVQKKFAFMNNKGRIKILNQDVKEGEATKHVADIYQCNEKSSSWHSIPIPSSFKVKGLAYRNGLYSFISMDNQVVEGTLLQINKSMLDVSFAVNGFKESEVESCFLAIPSTFIEPPLQRQTLLDNPSIHNKLIGQLVFDESLQQFSTDYNLNGSPLHLYVETAYREKAKEILIQVEGIINHITEFDQQARSFAATQLLDLKNEVWLDEDEVELSINEFIYHMSIESISFEEDGAVSIWYADGDLFWGHSIMVSYNKEGQPIDVSING